MKRLGPWLRWLAPVVVSGLLVLTLSWRNHPSMQQAPWAWLLAALLAGAAWRVRVLKRPADLMDGLGLALVSWQALSLFLPGVPSSGSGLDQALACWGAASLTWLFQLEDRELAAGWAGLRRGASTPAWWALPALAAPSAMALLAQRPPRRPVLGLMLLLWAGAGLGRAWGLKRPARWWRAAGALGLGFLFSVLELVLLSAAGQGPQGVRAVALLSLAGSLLLALLLAVFWEGLWEKRARLGLWPLGLGLAAFLALGASLGPAWFLNLGPAAWLAGLLVERFALGGRPRPWLGLLAVLGAYLLCGMVPGSAQVSDGLAGGGARLGGLLLLAAAAPLAWDRLRRPDWRLASFTLALLWAATVLAGGAAVLGYLAPLAAAWALHWWWDFARESRALLAGSGSAADGGNAGRALKSGGERALRALRPAGDLAARLWGRPGPRSLLLALAGLAACALLWTAAYPLLFNHVVSFTPQGLVTGPGAQIRVRFSGDLKQAGADLAGCFQVEPPLPGSARMEDRRTLVFDPSQPLRPSTRYRVTFTRAGLKSASGLMQGSATASFFTPPFRVEGCRLFYDFDLVRGTEKTLVGELDFNDPVDPEALKKALTVTRQGQDKALPTTLEMGSLPTRFFFRAGGFERRDRPQVLEVRVDGGLGCVGGTLPLGRDFRSSIELPAKPKLDVQDIALRHLPGQSLIAVRFSLPVSADEARRHIHVTPDLPFTVRTEYVYAALKADFQPNTDYTVTVDKGIRAASGEVMEQGPVTKQLRLEDLPPSLDFADQGHLLSLRGPLTLAVKTVNLDHYQATVSKIYRNNLVDFLKGGNSYDLGTQVWSGQVRVKGGEINQEVETDLNFGRWQSAKYKGLFLVDLRAQSNGGGEVEPSPDGRAWGALNQHWYLATDLGLMAKRGGGDLWAQVVSISTLKPLAGVKLDLVSRNNQVMQSQVTDDNGRALFPGWRQGAEGQVPFVLVASRGEDFSFLQLDQPSLNQERFDVSGDPVVPGQMQAFLSSDRGLYRPGATVHFTAVVRRPDLGLPPALPVRLDLRDPSGNLVASQAARLDGQGMASFAFPLPSAAPSGTLAAVLGMDNGVELARASVKVEEFIPDKIKARLLVPEKPLSAGEAVTFTVEARQLFGPPASGLKVRPSVELLPDEFRSKAYPLYRFGDDTRSFRAIQMPLPQGTTDGEGRLSVSFQTPADLTPPSRLKALVWAEVFDSGGRPVGANATFRVDRYDAYVGLKAEPAEGLVPGRAVTLRYVVLDPSGRPSRMKKAVLLVKRRVRYSIFRQQGWNGRGFESGTYEQVVLGREVDLGSRGSFTFTPDKPGEYAVTLGQEEGMRSRLVLRVAGPAGQPDEQNADLETPDRLSMDLDRAAYQAGQQALLRVNAPFAGRLLLSVEREKVLWSRGLEVPAGFSQVSLPVDQADLPNAYVVGLLVRRPDEAMRRLPMTSFGVVPLRLDTGSRRLAVDIRAPATVGSAQGIDADLRVEGAPGCEVVVAAVDEGILQEAGFDTPDPWAYFYRKRGLSTATWTLFNQVLPNLQRKDAVGGDEGMLGDFSRRHLNPVAAQRVRELALYSGILKADARGRVRFHVPTQGFHGDVRLMAMAVDGRRFGASDFHCKVADDVVVQPELPRFLAPGDSLQVPVMVFNTTPRPLTVNLSLKASGPVALQGADLRRIRLDAMGQAEARFPAQALEQAGVARFHVLASIPGGKSFHDDEELAVRPAQPLDTVARSGELAPGARVELAVPGGFIPQGQRVRLTVSSSPLVTYLRSLDSLIAYPWGCNEQVTSQAFPLLYFRDMGLLTGRFSGRADAVQDYVQGAVDRLCRQQLPDGGFATWPGQTESEPWLSNYVTDFLLEASRLGYRVRPETLGRIRQRLGAMDALGTPGRLDRSGENVERDDSAYLLYLRVLAGVPDRESMAALRDHHPEKMPLTDRCLLSLAYSALGDTATARSLLPAGPPLLTTLREMGGDLDSPDRELSLNLLALAECDPLSPQVDSLVKDLGGRMKDGHFGTTQDDAWAFMALGRAISRRASGAPLRADWGLKGGGSFHDLTGDTATLADASLSGRTLVLRNRGSRPAYYTLLAEGWPLKPRAGGVVEGIRVEREYRDEQGRPLNLGAVEQGQLVVVTLKVTCLRAVDNLVIDDPLPAGLEIDNPRLRSRGSLGFDPPNNLDPARMDFRDDRVLLFTGREDPGELDFSYSARAVTPGRFRVPGLEAEAMYDPDIHGSAGGGQDLVVTENRFDAMAR